ncbi:DUF4139 domain-containing protein [Xenophilus sp.]|uniref:DUF4139 domain-containing protein n=1 Tax=Xenophilus sp. TaxID=1873499 RepID=UPI0037DC6440
MPSLLSPTLRLAPLAALLAASAAAAQSPAASRITQVKVYPGSATVERVAQVAAGSRSIRFDCLPAGLDPQNLQLNSDDATVQIGEASVQTGPRSLSAACAASPLDERIRALEDQKAALAAQADALGYVTGYLQGLGGDGERRQAAPGAAALAATAEALRRTGEEALLRRHQLARGQADIDRQLQPLLAERRRAQGDGDAKVSSVTVTLHAPREARLRLAYQVAGPGWTPAYRAALDSATGQVRIERQALVAQATGEDWRGVKLVLATGQPRRGTAGRTPPPWQVGLQPPPSAAKEEARLRRAMSAPAAAPVAMAQADTAAPLFDASVFQGSFATEFAVPQPIDVPSGGQRVAMTLERREAAAQLAVRISPREEAAGYLVAEFDAPEGVWPEGALQLWRDGAFAGTGRWTAPANADGPARMQLSFGRDELVRVQAEPERDSRGSGGFVGSRAERRVQRAYVVENRHRTPMAVQVLEAAPVSVDDEVKVRSQFSPQPAERDWNRQPGIAMWRAELAPGRSARFTAEHTIAYPKDAQLSGR